MLVTATPRRFVSFYLAEASGHQSMAVEDSLLVTDISGRVIGTFPREPAEDFSWYLCPCEKDPTAWRARGPTDFHCPLCKKAPKALMVCSCGVVSPVEGRPVCGWCGRSSPGPSHACRSVGGHLEVWLDAPLCSLCGDRAAAPLAAVVTPQLAGPVKAAAEIGKVLKSAAELALDRLAHTTASPKGSPRPPQGPVRVPKPEPPTKPVPIAAPAGGPVAAPVQEPPPKPAPQAAAQSKAAAPSGAVPVTRKRPTWLFLLLVAMLGWGIYAAWHSVSVHSSYTRGLAALSSGRVIDNSGAIDISGTSAVDLYEKLAREDPGSDQLRGLGMKIAAVLRPQADGELQKFHDLSEEPDQGNGWPRLTASYGFLAELTPQDHELPARQAYCDAQAAFKRDDYEAALAGYQKAHDLLPHWALALNGLGKVYIRARPPLRDVDKAQQFYAAAHEADPNFLFSLVNLAWLEFNRDNRVAAKGYLQQILDLAPRSPVPYRELGRFYLRQGNRRQASAEYHRCLQYESRPSERAAIEEELRRLDGDVSGAGVRR